MQLGHIFNRFENRQAWGFVDENLFQSRIPDLCGADTEVWTSA